MDELVQRLSQGEHAVLVGGSRSSLDEFRRRIEEVGYVFVTFPNTRGGTELGVRVDKSATDLSQASFAQARGVAHVEGTLVLNSMSVRCVADIDLKTLSGRGHLVVVEAVHLYNV